MEGILADLLVRRYGEPEVGTESSLIRYVWNGSCEPLRCVLYAAGHGRKLCGLGGGLGSLYGDALGGSLIRGALKIATREGIHLYGLYELEELQSLFILAKARVMVPQVQFFMDASNVCYYGVSEDDLHVYDAECDELYVLGPLAKALDELLGQWEETSKAVDLA